MYCPYCGTNIQDGSNYCAKCGNSAFNQSAFDRGGNVSQAYAIPARADQVSPIERAEFIQKTYTHMALAVLAFIVLETLLVTWSGAKELVQAMLGGSMNWLIVLGLFMLVSHIADKWARTGTTPQMQYAGLGLYVFGEAIIFLPILYIAKAYVGTDVIGEAGIITIGLFAGLSFVAFTTKKDFSFLGGILKIGSFIALGFIAASLIFGFTPGILFSFIMVAFAAGCILYTTSNIIHQYRTDQYVAAALALFSSIMLLFWYILRILMSRRD